jgi:hypothetical protein
MAAVSIDAPERSTVILETTAYVQFYDINRNPRVTLKRFLDHFTLNQSPSQALHMFPYVTNIEDHEVWQKNTA